MISMKIWLHIDHQAIVSAPLLMRAFGGTGMVERSLISLSGTGASVVIIFVSAGGLQAALTIGIVAEAGAAAGEHTGCLRKRP